MPEPGQDNTPLHSQAFGPAEDADATRQAQHTMSNDHPTDVNVNAALSRYQGLTAALAASGERQNSERLHMLANQAAAGK